MASMLRVLIADDHPLVRVGVAHILAERPDTAVRQVGSVAELRESLLKEAPDVLILDLNMPGGNGLDAIPEIRRTYPRLAILVLSVHPEAQAGVKAISAGAHGYLNKTAAPDQFIEAVLQVASGGRYVSPTLGAALAEDLFRGRSGRLPHEMLSGREYGVLLKIAEGLTTKEIAAELNLSPKTVGTYRARVLEKMALATTAELTRYVVENGLDHHQD
jgi:two-component system invasion response regulator UvrY